MTPPHLPTWTAILSLALALPAAALDDQHWRTANDAINRGIDYLRTTQNDDGSWTPDPGPAVTALAVRAMLARPDVSPNDTHVAKALRYILSKAQPDGAIHDGILANYNTAISLSALARVSDDPAVAPAVKNAQAFLQGLQWTDQHDPDNQPINEAHPYYGGAGYGKHGRPDMSNTQIMLEGLYDSGLDCNSPAFKRALIFITRCQGTKLNDAPWADQLPTDGGFIYATSLNKQNIGTPQSQAGHQPTDPAQPDATPRLRTYGSMTYAGFKSYIYANLDRDDPRVVDAYNWIRSNYTLDRNPGMPEPQHLQGLYYYYMTLARAMDAWGSTHITTPDGEQHDWANDLIDQLAARQRDDGSWVNHADRWMESDPNLVTAYALIALIHATD